MTIAALAILSGLLLGVLNGLRAVRRTRRKIDRLLAETRLRGLW